MNALKVIHLNDSKILLGGRKDRHARLGRGEMGEELLSRIVSEPAFRDVPFIIETPVPEEDAYADEIRRVKQWTD